MATMTNFCEQCGAARRDPIDAFCRGCGFRYFLVDSTKGPLDLPTPPRVGVTVKTEPVPTVNALEMEHQRSLLMVGALTALSGGLYFFW
jgi:hypothetical protein